MTGPQDPRELWERLISDLNAERARLLDQLAEVDARLTQAWYELGRLDGGTSE